MNLGMRETAALGRIRQETESPMKHYGIAVWLILLVAVVSAIAGLIPLLRGRPMNVTFVALGGFWFIVAMAAAAKARKRASSANERIP